MSKFIRLWFEPIDASSLAVFRIMFGALLLFESVNYGAFLCLDCMYRESSLLFKYQYFEWAGLLPGRGLEIMFVIMGLSALFVMLGLVYRAAMLIFTVCFSYLFLLDQALYLNHFYLVILFCCIMIVVPAHHCWSIDAIRRPSIASSTVPAWSRFWLVAQLEIVLLYAGVAKLNLDWLNLEPMRLWMNAQSQNSHAIFQYLTQDAGIALASYGVLALHLIGAPLLLWRKTRMIVFLIYCMFHLINALVFNIGIFPWMTLAATLLFFAPDWPKQFYRWYRLKRGLQPSSNAEVENVCNEASTKSTVSIAGVMIVLAMSVWLMVQLTAPLRHWFMPGDVAWNEAGHHYSWRMKLRDKRGTAQFYVLVNDEPALLAQSKEHLNRKQIRKMNCNPDLIWQYAQFLEREYTKLGSDEVKVYVDAMCSLNTREPASLINRLIDLTAIDRDEPVQNWVLPLTKKLPKKYISL